MRKELEKISPNYLFICNSGSRTKGGFLEELLGKRTVDRCKAGQWNPRKRRSILERIYGDRAADGELFWDCICLIAGHEDREEDASDSAGLNDGME